MARLKKLVNIIFISFRVDRFAIKSCIIYSFIKLNIVRCLISVIVNIIPDITHNFIVIRYKISIILLRSSRLK